MSFERATRQLNSIGDALEQGINVVGQQVAIGTGFEVAKRTPVDTTLARSNWQGSLDSPRRSKVPPFGAGRHLGVNETVAAAGVLAQLESVFRLRVPGQDMYITNNIHYMADLNDGSSSQAPPNFIDLAVMKGVRIATEGLEKLGVRVNVIVI